MSRIVPHNSWVLEDSNEVLPDNVISKYSPRDVIVDDAKGRCVNHLPDVENGEDKMTDEVFTLQEDNKSLLRVTFREIFLSGTMPNYRMFLIRAALELKRPEFICLFIFDIILRGISQVFLCDHPISGIFICAGLACSSWELVGFALLGSAFGSLGAATIGGASLNDLTTGLCGYDGALIACACWAFFSGTVAQLVAISIVGSFLAGIVTMSTSHLLAGLGVPEFTFAFNLVQTMLLLSVSTGNATFTSMKPALSASTGAGWDSMSVSFMVDASIRGVGQFMFADTTYGSALIIVGIGISSRIDACAAWLGATVAALTAYYIIQVPLNGRVSIRSGLFGYNAAGTCAALAGSNFFEFSIKSVAVGLTGAALCVLVQTTFMSILGSLWSLPVLTFPFIVTTWLMMITKTTWLVRKSQ